MFDARRVAGRILGQGDVVALVEKAAAGLRPGQGRGAWPRKLAKGQFDLDDLADQLRQMQKMGGMQGMMGLLPGVQKIKKQIAESGVDDKIFDRQEAIISLDDQGERKKPDILPPRASAASPPAPGVEVPRSTAC